MTAATNVLPVSLFKVLFLSWKTSSMKKYYNVIIFHSFLINLGYILLEFEKQWSTTDQIYKVTSCGLWFVKYVFWRVPTNKAVSTPSFQSWSFKKFLNRTWYYLCLGHQALSCMVCDLCWSQVWWPTLHLHQILWCTVWTQCCLYTQTPWNWKFTYKWNETKSYIYGLLYKWIFRIG